MEAFFEFLYLAGVGMFFSYLIMIIIVSIYDL